MPLENATNLLNYIQMSVSPVFPSSETLFLVVYNSERLI